MICHKVSISPFPCPRPRINRKTGGVYYPKTYMDWRKVGAVLLQLEGLEAITDKDTPIELWVDFYLKGVIAKEHTSKPDLDNLLKAFMDLLVDSGLLPDDAQVQSIKAGKHHLSAGKTPYITFGYKPTEIYYHQQSNEE